MTRKLTLTLASALALALAAGAVQAQDRAPRGPGMMPDFATLDTDGDGKITREELEAHRLDRIKSLDPDGDGFITLEEMKTRMGDEARKRAEAMAERIFERVDADKDGKISAAEGLAAKAHGRPGPDFGRLFDRVDRDGDGAISKEEFERAARWMHQRGEGRPGFDRRGEDGPKRPHHAREGHPGKERGEGHPGKERGEARPKPRD